MKLTPLDIHQKEFRHGLRGYVEEEVDQFLDQVATELERLFKENIDLSDKIEQLQAKVDEYDVARHTINNTLLTAQRSADEIVMQAKIDAETTIAQANSEAEAAVTQAKDHAASIEAEMARQHRELVAEIARVKQLEETFRDDFRAILDKHMAALTPMAVPSDVERLLETPYQAHQPDEAPAPAAAVEETTVFAAAEPGDTQPPIVEPRVSDEPEAFVDNAPGPEFAPGPDALAPEPADEPEPAPEPEPALEPEFASAAVSLEPAPETEPAAVLEPAVEDATHAGATVSVQSPTPPWFSAQPEASAAAQESAPVEAVVSSIVLGEIESEANAAAFETRVMDEISLPGFDALGELDEDVEEID